MAKNKKKKAKSNNNGKEFSLTDPLNSTEKKIADTFRGHIRVNTILVSCLFFSEEYKKWYLAGHALLNRKGNSYKIPISINCQYYIIKTCGKENGKENAEPYITCVKELIKCCKDTGISINTGHVHTYRLLIDLHNIKSNGNGNKVTEELQLKPHIKESYRRVLYHLITNFIYKNIKYIDIKEEIWA